MKTDSLYAGKILWVDLTDGKVWTTPTVAYAERFLGGKGIGVRIVWEKSGLSSVDPLGSDNVLSFDSGPLTGTMMPGSGRCHISSKSPLTNLLGAVSFGGSFAPELKYAGYDHLVITGQAEEPVYLLIENEEVTIRSAANLWGLDTYETPKALRKELKNDGLKWACIGPAGERLIRFATIVDSTRDTAGRTGLGAVMGSKRLKAVAVRGTGGLRIASPERFYEVCARTHEALKASDPCKEITDRRSLPGMSTHIGLSLPQVKDFRRNERHQKMGCFSCPMRCIEECRTLGINDDAVYYQWFSEMATKIGVRDTVALQKLALCINKYGYDAVSLGDIIAWATKLYEQGIIDEKDVGFPLAWEDGEGYVRLAEMIATREGFGDVLAEGLMRAAQVIGRGSERYVFCMAQPIAEEPGGRSGTQAGNSKEVSQESVQYYGRFAEGIAGTRLAFPEEYTGKAEKIAYAEDAIGRAELLGTCKWHTEFNTLPITASAHAEVLSIGLGKKVTADELSVYQQRVCQLERAFDCREGLRRQHDILLDQLFEGTAMDRREFEAMKDRYYQLRGWDLTTGVPTRATLESFGLKDVADELERRGMTRGVS
jgi:aldehyde:ferredoxin oxidoreductase